MPLTKHRSWLRVGRFPVLYFVSQLSLSTSPSVAALLIRNDRRFMNIKWSNLMSFFKQFWRLKLRWGQNPVSGDNLDHMETGNGMQ